MTVQKVIDLASRGELFNLAVKGNTEAIIGYLNLAIIELSKRFVIELKAEVIRTSAYTNVYSLRNKDVIQVWQILDSTGRELKQQDVVNSVDYDYKLIGMGTFMLNRVVELDSIEEVESLRELDPLGRTPMIDSTPPDRELLVVYKASPELITSADQEFPLADIFVEPTLSYVSYKANISVTTGVEPGNNGLLMKFEHNCASLETYGYTATDGLLFKDLRTRGFV